MSIVQQYTLLKEQYQNQYAQAHKTANSIAILRLIIVLLGLYLGYLAYNMEKTAWILGIGFVTIALFLFLINKHLKCKEQVRLFEALRKTNAHELSYLEGDLSPFKTGNAYIQTDHPYSYDLDIFGEKSIFQHINRTTTAIGEKQLGDWLKNTEQLDIPAQQEAVRELGLNINWRQNFHAIGLLYVDEDLNENKFRAWLKANFPHGEKSVLRIVSYVLPILTLIALMGSFVSDVPLFSDAFKYLFFANLIIVAFQKNYIQEEHRLLSNTSSILKKYGKLLETIENQDFHAKILRGYQVELKQNNSAASSSINHLSRILNQFDTILNPFAAILMNGLFQYHLHAIFDLEKWKNTHKDLVFNWFSLIAKFEALSSIGNFAYNHPDFIFPELTDTVELDTQNIGHPLIDLDKRICNDVRFVETKFIVLTGSNMSGKSTFLRTLGVNLVLAKLGSPVCASRFVFYPFNVHVSMRIDDSLQNSESLFFSEIKRLKGIIETLDNRQKPFIILDEILRGTNSNDKRAGTQGLIHRLIAKNAVGLIATHDLVIGDMIQEYPQYLSNQCFEAEIKDDILRFDYKLKEGICQQMSAAFLMKKMDII
jgi:DNA mismatch repair ATPase MutS